jgi:hypothetical protein
MDRWEIALRLLGIGFYIGGCLVFGVLAGRWLDSKLNKEPFFALLGLFLGLVTAAWGTYRMLRPFLDNQGKKGNG